MWSQIFYLIRSRQDGQYLVAHPRGVSPDSGEVSYLLLFHEQFDALSYLNTHGSGMTDRFAVESIAGSQLKSLMARWGFKGVGIVTDPLLPKIDFLQQE